MECCERAMRYKLAQIMVGIKSALAFITMFWTFLQWIGAPVVNRSASLPCTSHSGAQQSSAAGRARQGQHRESQAEINTGFKRGLTDPLGRECSPKPLLKTPLRGVRRPLPRSAPQMAFLHRSAPVASKRGCAKYPYLFSRDCSGRLYARSARQKQLSGTQIASSSGLFEMHDLHQAISLSLRHLRCHLKIRKAKTYIHQKQLFLG